jgi:outer membrane protein assembly factor BamB
MSLSGDNADLGELYRDSYELTIQRINEAGGVEAGDGNTYELEMVLRDDESDASEGEYIVSFRAGGAVNAAPTVTEDRVLFATTTGYVVATRAIG